MPERHVRPTIYNRPWHMDADERRHHGRRRWEPAAVEALVELLSSMEGVYPPDWSDRDLVRFRSAGSAGAFAELWTDRATALRLVIHVHAPPGLVVRGCRINRARGSCSMLIKSPAPIREEAMKKLLGNPVAGSVRPERHSA